MMRSEYIIGFSLLVLSGCQLPVINGKKNFFDYRNERIAIIAFKAADNVPETVWDGMLNSVEQELQDHPEVSQAFFCQGCSSRSGSRIKSCCTPAALQDHSFFDRDSGS
jgi:hypothetical protein